MYEFAYNEVIEETRARRCGRASARRWIGSSACCAPRRRKRPLSRERVEALFYLRKLWTIFLDDLKDPDNEPARPNSAPASFRSASG